MKKMLRSKIITAAIIFAALLILFGKGSFFTKTVYAAGKNNESGQTAVPEPVGSSASAGTCGEGVGWTFVNGTLTISGTGAMTDYKKVIPPWYSNWDNINRIVIEDGVTRIGDAAFVFCNNLTSVEIPKSVMSIGDRAFQECSSLTSIEIPSGVTNIGNSTFQECSSLTSIEIPSGVTSIGNFAFFGCTGFTSVEIPSGVTSIGEEAFSQCTSLTKIEIPTSVTSLGDRVFEFCEKLTSITIPFGVTSIGEYAFGFCEKLTDISIPQGVTSIGDYAFFKCHSLTSISIPSSVTSIGEGAFYECTGLTSITIPSGVRSMGYGAFFECWYLDKVYYGGTNWDAFEESIEHYATWVNTFAISDIDGHTYDGSAYSPTPMVDFETTLKRDVDYTLSYERENGSLWEDVTNAIDAGTYRVKVTGKSESAYAGISAYKEFSITQKSVTITAASKDFTYDGEAHSWPEYDVTGLVGTDSIEAKVTGSISSASQSPVANVVESYKFKSGKPENYIVTTENGVLTMKAEEEDAPKTEEEEAPKTEVEASDKEPTENVVGRKFFSGIKVFQKNGSFRISWDMTEGVSKYEVYMTYCGSQYAKKPVVTTTNNKVTIKKLKGKKLNLKKNIKIYVAAYDGSGNSVGKTVSSHVAGKDSKKYTNPKEIKLTTKALTLSKGETVAVKATLKYESKKKKQVGDGHAAKFRYASTDPAIATVDKNGSVTAVASGNCTIYVYSVNGLAKTVTVTVN